MMTDHYSNWKVLKSSDITQDVPAQDHVYQLSQTLPTNLPPEEGFVNRDLTGWELKTVVQWTPSDVVEWIVTQLMYFKVKNPAAVYLEAFVKTSGKELLMLSMENFVSLIPEFGKFLYHQLQVKISSDEGSRSDERSCGDEDWDQSFDETYYEPLQEKPLDLNMKSNSSSSLYLGRASESELILNCDRRTRDWETKAMELWTPADVVEWIIRQLFNFKVENPAAVHLEVFVETSGKDLMMMSRETLEQLIPGYGAHLYDEVQKKQTACTRVDSPLCWERKIPKVQSHDKPLDLKINSCSSSETNKQSPGRVGRVWEFIRDLLLDPNCRHVISWEDPAYGMFRFEDSALVAKLWGNKRGNSRMNFKKFSRAIRYNYKMGYLLPVEKSRLVYKFGEKATGWRRFTLAGCEVCNTCKQPYSHST